MKLKKLKSRWGLYLILFYLFVATITLDVVFYGSRAFHREIPHFVEMIFLYITFGIGILVESIYSILPDFVMERMILVPTIFIINIFLFYLFGFILEKLFKSIN